MDQATIVMGADGPEELERMNVIASRWASCGRNDTHPGPSVDQASSPSKVENIGSWHRLERTKHPYAE